MKETENKQTKTAMKENLVKRRPLKLEATVASIIGSLSYEVSKVYKKTLTIEVFGKIRKETIAYLLKNNVKVNYASNYQYNFIKIYYDTKTEEKIALKLITGIKKIIEKNIINL